MHVAFRTDASSQIGTGHVMRCLTLADALCEQGAECRFVCREHEGHLMDHIRSRGYEANALFKPDANGPFKSDLAHASWLGVDWQTDADQTRQALGGEALDWLIVDHYALDHRWESALRSVCNRVMVIDDLADRQHDCDLFLDQNYFSSLNQRYQDLLPDHCISLLGPGFVLLRQEFHIAKQGLRCRDATINNVLVFFGGNDSANQTEIALRAFEKLQLENIAINVVVGHTNPNRESIRAKCEELPTARYLCNVTNMAELIADADLGIGAGGSAMWERCYLGLPTITVVVAENQLLVTKDTASIGAIEYLGISDFLDIDDYIQAITNLIADQRRLWSIKNAALELFKQKSDISVIDMILNYKGYAH
jgi:UDP-2,4-diacetamido-2,4,6-trideoxy-beta-L-altropyranose hydrolase